MKTTNHLTPRAYFAQSCGPSVLDTGDAAQIARAKNGARAHLQMALLLLDALATPMEHLDGMCQADYEAYALTAALVETREALETLRDGAQGHKHWSEMSLDATLVREDVRVQTEFVADMLGVPLPPIQPD